MGILLIPLVFAIIGVIVFFSFKKAKKQFDNISNVERSSVDEIKENHESFLTSFGAGTYQHYVELYGTVQCAKPLIAPVSGTKCVYYEYSVTRNFEEQVKEKNSEGKMETRTVSESETLSSGQKDILFELTDKDHKIAVLPESATIYPQESFNSQPSALDHDLANKLSVPTYFSRGRTTDFSITEKIIPLGQQLYVLGEANDRSGQLAISKPRDKEQSFILSTSSEDVLKDKLESKVKWTKIGFIALFALAALSLVYALLNLPAGK